MSSTTCDACGCTVPKLIKQRDEIKRLAAEVKRLRSLMTTVAGECARGEGLPPLESRDYGGEVAAEVLLLAKNVHDTANRWAHALTERTRR